MKKLILAAALALGVTPALAQGGKPYAGHELAKLAKVSMEQAEAIALKARPGTIKDRELEKEKGGSGLRYTFDVVGADGKKYEVGVDAADGKVLENGLDNDKD
ncbi:PepSY domain-containing protein [uncultured Caulobacter sp.]|uniref:PepSY domain-containing protein n=1 Tax=uncultured Caulobacter sp. TaxID=158749 RepID=UPI0026202F6A|nr:PepSY domain-containing protein [uncultured Caulobacter sp.]